MTISSPSRLMRSWRMIRVRTMPTVSSPACLRVTRRVTVASAWFRIRFTGPISVVTYVPQWATEVLFVFVSQTLR